MGSAAYTHHLSRFRYLIAILLLGAASPKEQAQKLVEAGNAHFDASRWSDAVVAYESALELYPSPRILVNLAEAQRRLGHWGDALVNFQKFIDEDGGEAGTRIRQSILARIQEIHDRSARLVLIYDGEAPDVVLDAVPLRGKPGVPILLAPGRHQLIVRAPGRPAKALTVTIEAGSTLRLPIEIAKPVEKAVAIAKIVEPAPTTPLLIRSAQLEEEDDTSVLEAWWFWTIVGAAVIGATAGTLALSHDREQLGTELGETRLDWGMKR